MYIQRKTHTRYLIIILLLFTYLVYPEVSPIYCIVVLVFHSNQPVKWADKLLPQWLRGEDTCQDTTLKLRHWVRMFHLHFEGQFLLLCEYEKVLLALSKGVDNKGRGCIAQYQLQIIFLKVKNVNMVTIFSSPGVSCWSSGQT